MKRGVFSTVFFLMCAFVCIPLTAQDSGVNYQTYKVETFDSPDTSEWTWASVGSKFIIDGYPILQYFDGGSNAMRVMEVEPDPDKAYKFLGTRIAFSRKGNNWVDIYPTKVNGDTAERYEIPFKGIVDRLDLWVWGAGYACDLEVLVRDCEGRVHTIPVGSLKFQGWHNLPIAIPKDIKQSSRYLSGVKNMKFIAFRIRTSPTEKVDDFWVFFDEFKALTNMHRPSYDGFELVDAKFENAEENKEGGK